MLKVVFLGVALALTVVAIGCRSAGQSSGTANVISTAEAAGVSIGAEWVTSNEAAAGGAYPTSEFLLLKLSLETHSGDLNEIDLASAVLEAGGVSVRAEKWVPDSGSSGHHQSGVLVFPKEASKGPAKLSLSVRGKELVLRWDSLPN